MLAVKLLVEQNIEVIALHIDIGFGVKEENLEILRKRATMVGGIFEVADVRDEYLQKILFSPKYGYGKQFNPCIDCHGFMFKTAKALLPHYNASFVATGEVVGQRPMSQNKDALHIVKKLANDLEDELILRPLSAKILEPTKPEKEGWVDREKLLNISGRGRNTQIALAKEFGWEDYPSPAGGCLLTDISFSVRLKDFVEYDTFSKEDIELLKNGRHFRLPDGAKLIVGRNESENDQLASLNNPKFTPLIVNEAMSAPFSLLSKNASQNDQIEASKIILTFTKASPENQYALKFGHSELLASPYPTKEEARKFII